MNEQIRSILAQETTKTSKIRQLYLLGVPRAEIARMVTNGNYGFVVNALRRMSECECGPNIQPLAAAPDYTFNRKFGIEIEAYNCSRERLARELREADIEVTVESYNHTTRPHWKLVTDRTGMTPSSWSVRSLSAKPGYVNWRRSAGCLSCVM